MGAAIGITSAIILLAVRRLDMAFAAPDVLNRLSMHILLDTLPAALAFSCLLFAAFDLGSYVPLNARRLSNKLLYLGFSMCCGLGAYLVYFYGWQPAAQRLLAVEIVGVSTCLILLASFFLKGATNRYRHDREQQLSPRHPLRTDISVH